MVLCGSLIGLIGSTLDSVLGATMQTSYLNTKTNRVAGHGLTQAEQDSGTYRLICGADILTNEQVNLVSVTICTALGGACLGPMFMT